MKTVKQKIWLIGPVLWLFSLAAHGADALVTGYHLKPASAIVTVGGTVKLKLVYCRVKANQPEVKPKAASDGKPGEKSIEDDLAPLVAPDPNSKAKSISDDLAPLPVLELVCEGEEGYGEARASFKVPADVKWQVVDGPGRVSGNLKGATYHAPASKPASNQATVSATFTYNTGREKTIALSRIKIVDQVEEYRGKATFQSPVAGIFATANVTWTLIKKKPGDDDDDDEGKLRYQASGTIAGKVTAPDCQPLNVNLVIQRGTDGGLDVDTTQKTYGFEFSSSSPITWMCGKPRQPMMVEGGSFFHFGSVCGQPEGVPVADLVSLRGTATCNTTGLFGTTTWTFEAVK